ncbi:MAG: hypothetical protein CVV30_03355 [Methanomicrobiales archaeon HGW-Methanomicrobiales-1]|nr:MAG: hypothetical protein CVV30_03355 [Methanomicrobiales archaeon HGW-Methanomicrobiales-1]
MKRFLRFFIFCTEAVLRFFSFTSLSRVHEYFPSIRTFRSPAMMGGVAWVQLADPNTEPDSGINHPIPTD